MRPALAAPTPSAVVGPSPPPITTGSPSGRPLPGRGPEADPADDRRRWNGSRAEARRRSRASAARRSSHWSPRDVDEAGAGGIGRIDRADAGQPRDEVVLRLEERRGAAQAPPARAGEPARLGRGVGGGRRDCRSGRYASAAPTSASDRRGLGRGAGVGPDHRRPDRLAIAIDQDHSRHLAGEGEAATSATWPPWRRVRRRRRTKARQPIGRLLLGPARGAASRSGSRVARRAPAAVGVEDGELQARRADVAGEDRPFTSPRPSRGRGSR